MIPYDTIVTLTWVELGDTYGATGIWRRFETPHIKYDVLVVTDKQIAFNHPVTSFRQIVEYKIDGVTYQYLGIKAQLIALAAHLATGIKIVPGSVDFTFAIFDNDKKAWYGNTICRIYESWRIMVGESQLIDGYADVNNIAQAKALHELLQWYPVLAVPIVEIAPAHLAEKMVVNRDFTVFQTLISMNTAGYPDSKAVDLLLVLAESNV